ncbi:DUF2946 domain-containing protein [Pigmentiphaga sp. NML080357]|uniref:DUF2946 domain-containing protein n=1 Tax=Pigmentiphaga sp. NML080357 TaxID=2008675 RepID=UPI0011853C74|nr:DUF2946 domain-containing protein [Pigmentiphaga sp. NML080357]
MHRILGLMRRFAHRHRHGAAWWLALALFVLKAAVPQGFMPGDAANRDALVVLCSANGPLFWHVEIPASKPGAGDAPKHGQAMHVACPFALAFAPGLPPGPPLALAGHSRLAYLLPSRPPVSQRAAIPAGAPVGARAPPRSA